MIIPHSLVVTDTPPYEARVTIKGVDGGLCTIRAKDLAPELLEEELQLLAEESSSDSVAFMILPGNSKWALLESKPNRLQRYMFTLEDLILYLERNNENSTNT